MKRPESEEVEPVEVAVKRPRPAELTEPEDEEDEEMMMLAGFSVEEETLMQVMKLLEEEINRPPANTNANPCSAISSPPSSSSSSFVTINGYEESCGPSFSDSSSTVMASFDMGSIFVGPTKDGLVFPFPNSGSGCGTPDLPPPSSAEEELEWPEIGEVSVLPGISEKGKGCEFGSAGESDCDDDWLARVLNGAPSDFVE